MKKLIKTINNQKIGDKIEGLLHLELDTTQKTGGLSEDVFCFAANMKPSNFLILISGGQLLGYCNLLLVLITFFIFIELNKIVTAVFLQRGGKKEVA